VVGQGLLRNAVVLVRAKSKEADLLAVKCGRRTWQNGHQSLDKMHRSRTRTYDKSERLSVS